MGKLILHPVAQLLILFIISFTNLSAQTNYNLILDRNYSSSAAAEDLITIHKAVYTVEGIYLKPKLFNEDIWYKKVFGIAYRFGKTVLIDNSIDHIISLTQHEIYGHGARYREFGYVNNHYHISLPPPYDCGGGLAFRGDWKYEGNRRISYHEHLAVYSGGMEANTVLAQTLITKWLSKKSINYRESYLYFSNRHNITSYILFTSLCSNDDNCENSKSNDVINYLQYLNIDNGYYFPDNYIFTIDDLAKQSWINLLDPFQFYAIFTYFKTYLWDGKEDQEFPMIRIGEIGYLPSFHLGLTPFGPEFYFENYFVFKNRILSGYYRQGDKTFINFFGFGFEGHNLFNNNFLSLNTKIDLWDQPVLKLGGNEIKETGGGIGGALSATLLFKVLKNERPVSIYTQLGYKTAGYLEGERLDDGLIIRLGLSFTEIIK